MLLVKVRGVGCAKGPLDRLAQVTQGQQQAALFGFGDRNVIHKALPDADIAEEHHITGGVVLQITAENQVQLIRAQLLQHHALHQAISAVGKQNIKGKHSGGAIHHNFVGLGLSGAGPVIPCIPDGKAKIGIGAVTALVRIVAAVHIADAVHIAVKIVVAAGGGFGVVEIDAQPLPGFDGTGYIIGDGVGGVPVQREPPDRTAVKVVAAQGQAAAVPGCGIDLLLLLGGVGVQAFGRIYSVGPAEIHTIEQIPVRRILIRRVDGVLLGAGQQNGRKRQQHGRRQQKSKTFADGCRTHGFSPFRISDDVGTACR